MRRVALTCARVAGWSMLTLTVVLAARTLAYAMQPHPTPLGERLAGEAGGPSIVVVGAVAGSIAMLVALGVTCLGSIAVRERHLLEPSAMSSSSRISVWRAVIYAVALWCASSIVFALLESYIHWKAGLGWHGLHCLVGPMHRDAIPFLGALSIIASALVVTGTHLVAWMRRVVSALRARTGGRTTGGALRLDPAPCVPPTPFRVCSLGARAPPCLHVVSGRRPLPSASP